MSLTIERLEDVNCNRVVVARRLYTDAHGQAVEPGDPSAVALLCSAGKPVLRSVLEAAGVKFAKTGGAPKAQAPTADKSQAPADNKADTTADDKTDEPTFTDGIPGSVKAAKVTIGMAGTGDLDDLEQLEAGRDGGPRAGVTKALAKRRTDLEE